MQNFFKNKNFPKQNQLSVVFFYNTQNHSTVRYLHKDKTEKIPILSRVA